VGNIVNLQALSLKKAMIFVAALLLLPGLAVGDKASESPVDRDFRAVEQALKPIVEGLANTYPDFKNLTQPEKLRVTDRQRRRIFDAGEAFVLQHPDDERVPYVLVWCFAKFFPWFFDQEAVLSPGLDALWESRKAAQTHEEQDQKYFELLGRMPRDPAAEADWIRRGDAMVATITAVPGITRENREQAEYLLLARWIMTRLHKHQYQAVDWSAFYPLFAAHVRKYADMERMEMRANDSLGAMRRASPEAAAAGWNYVLTDVQAHDGNTAAAKAIQTAAATALESIEIAASGKKFEALKFTALDGREIDVPALRGKVVLIDFWATWCKPCVEELPALQALHDTYREQGLEIIGISGDSGTAEELKDFLDRGGYAWPQHFDGKGPGNYFAELFAIKSWPTTYLLDRAGNPVAKNLRGAELETEIKRLLATQ
jgi:thiol-disulfide isomerase/thioredoxin